VYPIAVGVWIWIILSLRDVFVRLSGGEAVEPARLAVARRRLVHLPWLAAAVSGAGWFLGIPMFLISLAALPGSLSTALLWHIPISFLVSAFIAITQSFFLVEIASHRNLFPTFFRDARPDQLAGIYPLSLRARGLMWVASVGICPIGSLLLLDFAPPTSAGHPVWFAVLVGGIGIAFGLCTAIMIARLVADPLDELRAAMQAVAAGRFDVRLPLRRADEFGTLAGSYNIMAQELEGKERLRRTFGLHVGSKAAEQILARDPGLNGTEQVITVMFVDIRSFTARAAGSAPGRVVMVLNEFLSAMVHAVEEHHSGMINKFLGDGFMALFGAGLPGEDHADQALHAARAMIEHLRELNERLAERGEEPLAIGIGLHTGPAIVGSIGSAERLEFTAIGSTVNLASRIEALTKVVGETVVVGEATRAALRRPVELRALPPQPVKGVDEPVAVWALPK
jgi:adenylate cyclase